MHDIFVNFIIRQCLYYSCKHTGIILYRCDINSLLLRQNKCTQHINAYNTPKFVHYTTISIHVIRIYSYANSYNNKTTLITVPFQDNTINFNLVLYGTDEPTYSQVDAGINYFLSSYGNVPQYPVLWTIWRLHFNPGRSVHSNYWEQFACTTNYYCLKNIIWNLILFSLVYKVIERKTFCQSLSWAIVQQQIK